jgi:Spy/CpxP family protein refolding chaperone
LTISAERGLAILLAGLLGAGAVARVAHAASPPPPAAAKPAPGPSPPMADEMRAKIEHRIKTMRAMFLTEALDLDEPTSKKLFAVLDRFDEKRKALMAEREGLMRELRKVASKATDAEVDALIEKIGANRLAEEKLNLSVLTDVKPVLTAEQRAKLVMALPRFYAKMRKLIREARKDMLEKAFDDEEPF